MDNEYEGIKIPFAYLDDTEDDYCEHCKTRLEVSLTSVPYGDTYCNINECYCPNCD